MFRKLVRLLMILIVAIILVGGGWVAWHSLHKAQATNTLVLYGNVDIRQVQLAFNNSERIQAIHVVEGDLVQKGQLLAELDTSRLEARVNQARAQADAQKQVLTRLEAGSRPQEIRKARADVQAALAKFQNAEDYYKRIRDLIPTGAATVQQMINAQKDAEGAEGTYKAAQEVLDLAIAGPRKEDIAAAKATLQADLAELALLERYLVDARLFAPSDGIVQDRILEPGDMASPQQPVFTIALISPLWVRAYVDEADLGKIRPGMKAQITTDSFPGVQYHGWIGYISPTAEFTPKSVQSPRLRTSLVYQVRVYVENHRNELRLGMPATVTIPLGQSALGPHRLDMSATAPAATQGAREGDR